MDVTDATKALIHQAQSLKEKHSDPVSTTFIDFYCQCRQGCDYLFPAAMGKTVRLLDILNWFFDCIDNQEPPTLLKLMWQDVAGPTLQEYTQDQTVELGLLRAFESGALKVYINTWDRERNADGSDRFQKDGSVHLVLRDLLTDLQALEA